MLTFSALDALRAKFGEGVAPTLAEAEDMAQALRKTLSEHVVVQQLVREQELLHAMGREFRATAGWHALGEQLSFALAVITGHVDCRDVMFKDESPDVARVRIAFGFVVGTPYLWSSEIADLVEAAPLPPHIISRDILPAPALWWSDEVASLLKHAGTGEAVDGDGSRDFLFLMDAGDHLNLIFNIATSDGRQRLSGGSVRYGVKYPDDLDPTVAKALEGILKRLAFLRSPYIATREEVAPRAWRREMQHKGHLGPDPPVRVVMLRREAKRAVDAERDAQRRHVDWKHQWWVSGHYRSQWYPSKQAHEVVWIAPYLKGPADLPVGPAKVYVVKR